MGHAVLFVPVSGPVGTGEVMRCRIIADAVSRRWPDSRIGFVLSEQAAGATEMPFQVFRVPSSPTFHIPEVNRFITRFRPDVSIFDNAGRSHHWRHARQVGSRVVYISSRPNKRRRGFALHHLRLIDQHWLADPTPPAPGPTWLERLKIRLTGSAQPLDLGVVFTDPEPARRAALKTSLGLAGEPYLLFFHSGSRLEGKARAAPQVFASVASRVADELGRRCVVVAGVELPDLPPESPAGLVLLRRLHNGSFIDLLHDAELVVCGGGAGTIGQALALGKACLALPLAGEQARRISWCRRRSLVETAALEHEAMFRAVRALLMDRERRDRLVGAARESGLVNGLPAALNAIDRLVRTDATQSPVRRSSPHARGPGLALSCRWTDPGRTSS